MLKYGNDYLSILMNLIMRNKVTPYTHYMYNILC